MNCVGIANTQRTNAGEVAIAQGTESSSDTQKIFAGGTKSMSKYQNQKTEIDGITFASKHEAHRYIELKYMEKTGLIKNLQLQRVFTLVGPQRDKEGKVIERPVKYIADFVYKDQNGNTVVEDAKGMKTDVYRIKRKLMLSIYGIKIVEV